MCRIRVSMLVALPVALSACALTPGGDRPEFKASVHHMIQAQTYAPDDEVAPTRGDRTAAAMEAHRTDVGNPARFGRGQMGFD